MKLLTIQQVREWDRYTIDAEPVSSLELMERAGKACASYLLLHFNREHQFLIFCGLGNNGGDGLVIARLLAEYGYRVGVVILRHSDRTSEDFRQNLQLLHQAGNVSVTEVDSAAALTASVNGFPGIDAGEESARHTVIIDAILGSGTNKPLQGLLAEAVKYINASGHEVISIDVPAGLPGDIGLWHAQSATTIVKAHATLTFQVPKTSFLFPGPGEYCGNFKILDIGLHKGFLRDCISDMEYIDETYVNSLIRPRNKFDHKGKFGHALLIAGSRGKNGAAVLAARACLRSGVGLLTVGVPQHAYPILQTAVPEAMVLPDNSDDYPVFSFVPGKYTAVGVGAGIGTEAKTLAGYKRFLQGLRKPLVIDADGINLLAGLLQTEPDFHIPEGAVLTPHVKEFGRLAGIAENSYDRFNLLKDFAQKHHVYVILKGAHSCLACPDGRSYFNATGNPALAKGGSGDVLTGIITALLAQGYPPREAAILGMFFHGKAADDLLRKRAATSIIAGDLINEIGIAPVSFL